MNLVRVTVLGLVCAFAPACFAQWQWIDNTGHKVFSDQSPPADIPAKNILKQPGMRKSAAAADAAEPATAEAKPAAAASAPKLSGKDKELEEKKKQAQAAEADKKRAQEQEVAKARAENCTRAKRAKTTYDSGVRIARTNDKGEREIMDDTARAAESKRLEGVIATDCAAGG
jgi:hypothetical protein